jgi:hypothetical protein
MSFPVFNEYSGYNFSSAESKWLLATRAMLFAFLLPVSETAFLVPMPLDHIHSPGPNLQLLNRLVRIVLRHRLH